MLPPLLHPVLCQLKLGRPLSRHPLPEGTCTVGRDKANAVVLDDPSISRRHAEFTVADGSCRVRDLGSRNGTRVNGVPRKHAQLQVGDRLALGSLEFTVECGAPTPAKPKPGPEVKDEGPEVVLDQTRRQSLRLPDARAERQLAAFHHLCAWITEGVDERDGRSRWLELLLECLRGGAVHYYDEKGALAEQINGDIAPPRVKFAAYLLEKFRQLPEATTYLPKSLDRFQQRLGNFHYAVAPLRASTATPEGTGPVVVVLRPSDWEPFSGEDRAMLQSAVQLWLRSGNRAQEVRVLKQENQTLRRQTSSAGPVLLGQSAVMQKLRARIARIAATKATVLITGETGSGKEVVAHELHRQSPRASGPFIKVNCASIPAALMESELFGHVKGAFTDARADHKGRFLLADGGTLFLDEIGELPLAVQAKLLRVLETGEVERLGSERPAKVDVRILAATNRDLRAEANRGNFRADLLYRLEVARLDVPPLREHPEDIALMAAEFLKASCAENGMTTMVLSPAAVQNLVHHRWPGNVRELRNVMQRVAMESDQRTISAAVVTAALQ